LVPIKKQSKTFGLQLLMEPFSQNGTITNQEVQIYCNGLLIIGKSSTNPMQDVFFAEVHHSVAAFGALKIDMLFPMAKSPKSLNLSLDERVLGYKLFEIQILG
jgi:hypothetical protein